MDIDKIRKKCLEAPVKFHDAIFETSDLNHDEEIYYSEKNWRPTKAYKYFRITVPVDWASDPFLDAHWTYQLNALRPAVPFLKKYKRSGRWEDLSAAVILFVDWYKYNIQEKNKNKYKWYNMAVGVRAARLAFVTQSYLDLISSESEVRDNHSRCLISLCELHIEKLMNEEEVSLGNHGLFQMHGLMALSQIFIDYDIGKAGAEFSNRMMKKLIPRQFSEEGMHLEHSPAYHFFSFRVLTKILKTGWYDSNLNKLDVIIKDSGKWLVRPDSVILGIGDSFPSYKLVDDSLFNDEKEVFFGGANHTTGLVKQFPKSGYSIIRSLPSVPSCEMFMLFFTAAHHSGVHKHSDDMHFDWFDNGFPILTDTGCYGYKKGRLRKYVLSTAAHNTIECDGESSERAGVAAYGSALDSVKVHSWGVEITSELYHVKSEFSHKRKILYSPGKFLVCLDFCKSSRKRHFKQLWHFDKDLHLRDCEVGVSVHHDHFGNVLSVLSSSLNRELTKGQVFPEIQGWVCKKEKVMEPRFTLAFEEVGAEARFVTSFVFRDVDVFWVNNISKAYMMKMV